MASKTKIIQNKYRTHTCGDLSAADSGSDVRLSGWVHSRRDHGGLIFIDLRDKWGVTQLAFDPSKNTQVHALAERLRSEYVISVSGQVVSRPAEMINKSLSSGEIEIIVNALEILSPSKNPPFAIAADDDDVNEELRLQYRYLDLRHPRRQKMLKVRDDFISYIRQYMHSQDFTEVQTPILANSSPEGARDFLVPSRLYPGQFYALPQAPQQFKQLLMVGGLDKYFQIAPCFRDEDPRADRHAGAFYQIDLEMSFVEQEDIFAVVEPLMCELTAKFSDKKLVAQPFPRLTWQEAMATYGTDKPDLRFDLKILDVSQVVANGGFSVFNDVLAAGGVVHAIRVDGGAKFTRADIDDLTDQAKLFGAKGLAYILCKDELSSPIIKYLGAEVVLAVQQALGAQTGDAIFFGAGAWLTVSRSLGAVRNMAAAKLGLKDDSKAAWAWITDWPMYERNEEGKIDFSHNPFSMPQGGLEALSASDPTTILGYQYDLVLNGFEISSGAIRNHRPDIMYKAFALAGYSKIDVDKKFGALISAFEYGAPPHGGFAPGVDRLLMILLNETNIREIYAFPKDGKARDLMTRAPGPVSKAQLRELHLEITAD